MPLIFGPKSPIPGYARTGPPEITGESLSTRFPGTWQRDPGITTVKSEDWGSPGAGYSPSGTHVTEGPYRGYSLRAARDFMGGKPTPTAQRRPSGVFRTSSGFAAGQPVSPSAANPKRLWNYSLGRLAPGNTTLGRMRTLYGGLGSPMFRS